VTEFRPPCPPFPQALVWEPGVLRLLDQRRLPTESVWVECRSVDDVIAAIRELVVRGAPLLGVAAAYGVVLEEARLRPRPQAERRRALDEALARLATARPTAVNLAAAVARMRRVLDDEPREPAGALLAAAEALARYEETASWAMAREGASRLDPGARVLTHCNTGSLATLGPGTALGVVRCAWAAGRLAAVGCTETRPWGQGLRLTTYELLYSGIPTTLHTESAAGARLLDGGFDWLVVGADRIGPRGDVLNKIGTRMLACLARRGGACVMVVAPTTTVDPAWDGRPEGRIEERSGLEVWRALGVGEPPSGLRIANPVFDRTPAEDVDLVVTERGAARPGDPDFARVLGL
jgi:methylthioribose-1-phosphate isomerase